MVNMSERPYSQREILRDIQDSLKEFNLQLSETNKSIAITNTNVAVLASQRADDKQRITDIESSAKSESRNKWYLHIANIVISGLSSWGIHLKL